MPGMHDITAQLAAVEEKLHFLHQSITACRGAPLTPEALAGLAHIVSDLVRSVQETRRDVDGIRGREDIHCPGGTGLPDAPAEDAADDDDIQEQRRHGAA
ncbi:hypothetical protein [Megalodesulfovibrio gigas]|uniref:Uncharacterized protein n=1 Tax=Megalodesulfovibrio gigas (strain ATCC 19364 / DSM 1382 / NCIMB 9332 / VKM B-1759) TaxID=1121448 RepID=T2GG02_MEGG1|nr:hypothetical protein [Megalodesulfovibrio gigas]AGW14897.1 hypothetical protein DGI_3188 [Megalodesulfovibrio gigas DSM 1382 = ATCC 19364]